MARTPMKTARFIFSAEPGLFERIDEWRRKQPDLPSRAEATRRLVEAGLATGADPDHVSPTAIGHRDFEDDEPLPRG